VNRAELSAALAQACCAHLEDEEAGLNQLLELLLQNRQAMLDRNVDKLLETTRELRLHHEKAALTQRRRHRLRQQIGEFWEISAEQVTMSQCLRLFDSDLRERMRDLQRRLQDTVKSLDGLVQGNAFLASQFSLMIDQTLQVLSGHSVTPRYGASGQLDRSQEMSVFETRL
jgi:exonuclease VII large subunit